MWWFGYDIELSRNLNLLKSDAEKQEAYHKREEDRRRLLSALDKANVWPEDKTRHSDYIFGEGYPEGIEEAVERYMSKSASPVFLAQLEDFLHVEQMQNLPGTDRDQHPNWQRKVPVDLEKLSTDSAFIRCVQAIKRER
jgi:4-alpha-glucanotransferase